MTTVRTGMRKRNMALRSALHERRLRPRVRRVMGDEGVGAQVSAGVHAGLGELGVSTRCSYAHAAFYVQRAQALLLDEMATRIVVITRSHHTLTRSSCLCGG